MIYMLIADGFEEVEALTPLDLLRRAGISVKTVAIGTDSPLGAHGIRLICDLSEKDASPDEPIGLILPGGMPGTKNLDASDFVDRTVRAVNEKGGRIAAICAAPLILGRRGLLEGKKAVCYPGFENELRGAEIFADAAVITDGNITTSKGMGTAFAFGLELVKLFGNDATAEELTDSTMRRYDIEAEKRRELAKRLEDMGFEEKLAPFHRGDLTESDPPKRTDAFTFYEVKDEEVSESIKEEYTFGACESEGEDEKDEDLAGFLADEKFQKAVTVAIEHGVVATGLLQRKLSIGYGKAALFIDRMDKLGFIEPPNGAKPRKVKITSEDWSDLLTRAEITKKVKEIVQGAPPSLCRDKACDNTAPEKEEALVQTEEKAEDATKNRAFSGSFPLSLLAPQKPYPDPNSEENQRTVDALLDFFKSFKVNLTLHSVTCGPRILRIVLKADKLSVCKKAVGLEQDIALNFAARSVRAYADQKCGTVTVEMPHKSPAPVSLRALLESEEYEKSRWNATFCIGTEVDGKPIVTNLPHCPHLLIAGATGMGKSVVISSILTSLLYKASPKDLRLLLIDPKKVEFSTYASLPHLLAPVITESAQAVGALLYAADEIERRFVLMEGANARNIDAYNAKVTDDPTLGERLPRILIVIDELSDLMLQVKNPVEDLLMRIAQKGKGAGVHLIIGTQRPSIDVITGPIRYSIPAKLCLKVSSSVDSRLMFNTTGAEKLLGMGDMLFTLDGDTLTRAQGAFVSDSETSGIVSALSEGGAPDFNAEVTDRIEKTAKNVIKRHPELTEKDDEVTNGYLNDEKFLSSVDLALTKGKISASMIQRTLIVGYAKASIFIDVMEALGIVAEANGSKPREVLLTKDEWEAMLYRARNEEEDATATEQAPVSVLTAKEEKDYRSFPLGTLSPTAEYENACYEDMEADTAAVCDVLADDHIKTKLVGAKLGPRMVAVRLDPNTPLFAKKLPDISMKISAALGGRAVYGYFDFVTNKLCFDIERRKPDVVHLSSLLSSPEFEEAPVATTACIGRHVDGESVIASIAKLPHLLIGGAVETGKSTLIHSMLVSLLAKASPSDLQLILIDIKRTEFSVYRDIPHLVCPVINDVKNAAGALGWATDEMEKRYTLIERSGSRNIDAYNQKVSEDPSLGARMPKILIVIDELADLMMLARDEVENRIMSIAQKARAAGIHLVIATARPTIDVLTGLIRANIPSRITFKTPSALDSRTLMERAGAEHLLRNGDMLYHPVGLSDPVRVQAPFISPDSVARITELLRKDEKPCYDEEVLQAMKDYADAVKTFICNYDEEENEEEGAWKKDKTLRAAAAVALESGQVGTSLLQRKLSIGYGKAAKYLDLMEELGIIGHANGANPRDVLMNESEIENLFK